MTGLISILALASGGAALWLALRLRGCKTDNARLVQELEKTRGRESLGTFAGGIAHDFNNILGSISGFSTLLQEDLIAQPEQREMAIQIATAAKRGQGIVAQLLDYSKKARRSNDGHTLVSLKALAEESVSLVRPGIRSSTKISCEIRVANDTVMADATQLSQALVNLCINADHAIGVRAGNIIIALEPAEIGAEFNADGLNIINETQGRLRLRNGQLPAGDYLRLSVTDDGEGMTRDIAARIFDPFFTTKDVDVGTGLGLAAIEGIVQSHGGAIEVITERHRGTTFALMFPAGIHAAAPAAPQSRKVLP